MYVFALWEWPVFLSVLIIPHLSSDKNLASRYRVESRVIFLSLLNSHDAGENRLCNIVSLFVCRSCFDSPAYQYCAKLGDRSTTRFRE